MICSLWRFEMLDKLMLDHGDWMLEEPDMPIAGQSQQSIRPGLAWGVNYGRQNKVRNYRWSRVLQFATAEERLGFEIVEPSQMPVGESGDLVASIKNGATFTISNFVLQSCTPAPVENHPTWLSLTFEGVGGEIEITDRAGLGGLGFDELTENWEDMSESWD